jgi:hypothetical protein
MKLSTYIKEHFSDKKPLLRLTTPSFIEPSSAEMERIYKQLDLMESGLGGNINPLERLGLDLLLSSVYVNLSDKKEIRKLQEYLKTHD